MKLSVRVKKKTDLRPTHIVKVLSLSLSVIPPSFFFVNVRSLTIAISSSKLYISLSLSTSRIPIALNLSCYSLSYVIP